MWEAFRNSSPIYHRVSSPERGSGAGIQQVCWHRARTTRTCCLPTTYMALRLLCCARTSPIRNVGTISCRAQRRFSCASESSARRACTRGAQLHGQASGRIILFLSTAYSGGNSSLSFVSSQVWRRGVGSARAIDNTYRCMEALVSHLSIATRLVAFAKMCPLPAATAFGSARSTCAKSGVSYARHNDTRIQHSTPNKSGPLGHCAVPHHGRGSEDGNRKLYCDVVLGAWQGGHRAQSHPESRTYHHAVWPPRSPTYHKRRPACARNLRNRG